LKTCETFCFVSSAYTNLIMFSLMVLIFENRVLAYYSKGQTAEVLIQTSVRNTVFNGYCNILSK